MPLRTVRCRVSAETMLLGRRSVVRGRANSWRRSYCGQQPTRRFQFINGAHLTRGFGLALTAAISSVLASELPASGLESAEKASVCAAKKVQCSAKSPIACTPLSLAGDGDSAIGCDRQMLKSLDREDSGQTGRGAENRPAEAAASMPRLRRCQPGIALAADLSFRLESAKANGTAANSRTAAATASHCLLILRQQRFKIRPLGNGHFVADVAHREPVAIHFVQGIRNFRKTGGGGFAF